MDVVDHDELEFVLRQHYGTKLPLFVHGAPGIGKSNTAESVSKELAEEQNRTFVDFADVYQEDKKSMDGEESSWDLSGAVSVDEIKNNPEDYFVLVDLRLSQEDPTTSKGIPNTDGLSTTWAPPVWLNILSLEGISGILFADELNQAHPDVQAAYFQLVQKRQLAGRRLSDKILVISAGNREKDEADVKPIPAPLRNRFAAHVNLTPPTNLEWVEWAREFNAEIAEDEDSDELPIDFTVLQFIGSDIGDSHLFEDISDSPEKSAFQTPRTWQYAGQQLSQYRQMSDEFDFAVARDIVRRAVGRSSSDTYHGFLQASQEIDLENLFENPEMVNEIDTSLDVNIMYVLATSIQNYYRRSIDGENDVDPVTALENVFVVFEALPKDWNVTIFSDFKQMDENLLAHFEQADIPTDVVKDLLRQV